MANFVIETSARHVHVTREALDILFGKGFELEVKKPLSQPGQYASAQKVDVVGPKSTLKCSILGPVRPENQVELSFTDARTLGIVAPIRESGDVAGSAPCKIVGPCGEIELKEGVIIARRHVHMTPSDAAAFGVENGQIVNVEVENILVLKFRKVGKQPCIAHAGMSRQHTMSAGAAYGTGCFR